MEKIIYEAVQSTNNNFWPNRQKSGEMGQKCTHLVGDV